MESTIYGRCMNTKCSYIANYGSGCLHGEKNPVKPSDRSCVNCCCPLSVHRFLEEHSEAGVSGREAGRLTAGASGGSSGTVYTRSSYSHLQQLMNCLNPSEDVK
jgi:hypothetical protein